MSVEWDKAEHTTGEEETEDWRRRKRSGWVVGLLSIVICVVGTFSYFYYI